MNLKERQQSLTELKNKIAGCQRCSLHKTRTNTVPGEGAVDASIMFIGEAPGRNEDLKGKPFVGRAGAIFDRLLGSVDLSRDQIYLCNILKCRPPKNRNPLSDEINSCIDNLDVQIHVVNPIVIGTLGNFATAYILEKFSLPLRKISEVAGKVFDVQTDSGPKKLVPLFHPAVATYNPSKFDTLLSDFKIFKKFK